MMFFREMWKNGQDVKLEFDRISWDKEISLYEARRQIDLLFYPFKKVWDFLVDFWLFGILQNMFVCPIIK